MPSFKDQLGRTVYIGNIPERIISLVPSQTELLYALGLEDQVAGITKFCVHPEQWFRNKTRIGGTKNVDIEKVLSLRPDLIIANKEENVKEQVDLLAEKVPVWVSDVNTLQEAYDMMHGIGNITGRSQEANNLISRIKEAFNSIPPLPGYKPLTGVYLIWRDPYMAAGGDTFIHDMLTYCGVRNVFTAVSRYPNVSIQELIAADCDVVLLSSEPYPFKEKHLEEISAFLPAAKIHLVDGELFSWYGSRLQEAPRYFTQLRALLASET